jgi:hypothetical protein
MNDFDRELEDDLHRLLGPLKVAPIPPRRLVAPIGPLRAILGGAGAAIGAKVLTGIVVGAAAVTVAGAATEVASTGSLNPTDWGQQVRVQVETCKDTLRASGTRGIGQCVSQFARQHGALVSEHASGARENGNGHAVDKGTGNDHGSATAKTNGNGGGNGNGHSSGNGNGKGNGSGGGNGNGGGGVKDTGTGTGPVSGHSSGSGPKPK